MTNQKQNKVMEEFKRKYPTTWSKMDTNMRLDFKFFFDQVLQTKKEAKEIENLLPPQEEEVGG